MIRHVLVRAEVSGVVDVFVPDDDPDAIDVGAVTLAVQAHSITWDELHVLDWEPYNVTGEVTA